MIYITGDTHIPVDIQKLSSKRFPEQKDMTSGDYLIICGDFGGIWDGTNEEKYWLKWLYEKNFTTLFVDGNHENFDMLNSFPTVEFCGGYAHKINDKLYHLKRGEIYTIDGRKIFAFGGASSHDKEYRKEGINWWKEELPNEEDFENALNNLDKAEWNVDYVVTHCSSTSVQKQLPDKHDENILTDFFEKLELKLKFKKWYFGHYHTDINVDEKHSCVFSKITRI
jgi:hypothetical protein